ncbi:ABC transporter permease [Ruania alba]|uniref:NitT/TauT family transport system permease protein n=1 Tax=Ruania alba TaxID=648782 RepID=A0A1H5FXJ5_9MICO|nr:ABC transporter permease [Ruania alba]SEE07568.1 NitT/TauT family transport system permease protein [Ruania alba]
MSRPRRGSSARIADAADLVGPSVLPPVVLGVAGLLLWEIAAGLTPSRVLPAPSTLMVRLVAELRDGDILTYAGATLAESLLGCLIALVVALPLGYLIARSSAASAALGPYLAATQAIPAVALAPLIVLWFGYGLVPVALLCALLVFFPIVVNTALGLSGLDEEVLGAAQLDGAGRWGMLLHIEGPLAMPSVLAGVRNGFVLSITGAVVGEFVMGGQGLGLLLSIYRDRSDTTGMFATLIVLAACAVGFYLLVRALERRVRW